MGPASGRAGSGRAARRDDGPPGQTRAKAAPTGECRASGGGAARSKRRWQPLLAAAKSGSAPDAVQDPDPDSDSASASPSPSPPSPSPSASPSSSRSAAMIWYLLYPFRGTTEPPVLGPAHPLRRAFTRHGRAAARHPTVTLLMSVALGTLLSYPFPFLYTNSFASGSSNLPHHVWTAAQPFDGDVTTPPDVVMRSVWVHGSYMRALEQDVLLGALDIQDELLGPTVHFSPRRGPKPLPSWTPSDELTIEIRDSMHAINGLTNNSWFFHSPLLYWSCSREAILEDDNIVATVNAQSRRVTSVNVTLRHSIVFSGKRFEDRRLVAADALVIALLHKLDSPVGREWERRAEALAARHDGKWLFYPDDSRVADSQLYEFKFQPLSIQEDVVLGTAYLLAAAYFLLSLRKLRAMKSRLGLTITVVSQIAVSIMASFTICAVLKIDLSKIPREAYPLVVLTIGLENMFRLINAAIVAPSPSPTAWRIAEAVGQTGYVALAGVAQNLFILWLLCKVVSPGVAAFCVFAGIALTLDFLFLLTYFVAVLSVDVRRMELSDFLDRARHRTEVKSAREGSRLQTWVDALLRGELPTSTRVAGTIVMICLILLAQWHFFDSERPMRTILRLLRPVSVDNEPPTLLSVDVNQARTPTAWLRLQDHETAREVIQVVKPHSHSYIARVYNPLVLVLEGSDRTPSLGGIRPFLPAAYDFVKHQSMKFALCVILVTAAVSLLMNYLLWNENEMAEGQVDDRAEHDPLLGVKTLGQQHILDIVKIATCPEGVIASVGLDRRILVWDIRHDANSHMVNTGQDVSPFPIREVAIDSSAEWLALLSGSGRVMLWNITKRYWGYLAQANDIKGKSTVASFFFGPKRSDSALSLMMVRSSGLLTEMIFSSNQAAQTNKLQICTSPIICARQFSDKSLFVMPLSVIRIVVVSRCGSIYLVSQTGGGWVSEILDLYPPDGDREALSVLPLPQLQALLAIRRKTMDLIDLETRTIIHTFTAVYSKPSTVRCFHTVRQHPQRGSTGIGSLSLVYDERGSGACVLRTFTPEHENDVTPLGVRSSPQEESLFSWDRAVEQVHRVESPGAWVSLATGIVVGVRKRDVSPPSPDSTINDLGLSMSGLRRRGNPLRQPPNFEEPGEDDGWEAWMLSDKGESLTTPLCAADGNHSNAALHYHLLAARCGPIAQVGQRSAAVGLGNVIKVITIGNERFVDESASGTGPILVGRRRRSVVPRSAGPRFF